MVTLTGFDPAQHFTQPPARFTDASLIRAMEENGIGRPSTYAPTVSTILDREYVIKDGKYLKMTPLGDVVNGLMCDRFKDIVDVKFTAHMEEELDEVESGKLPWKQLLRQFYGGFESNLHQVEKDMEGVYLKVPDEVTEEKCDLCGRNMVIKSGRFGRFLACPGYPECKFTKPLVVEMPGRCPVCGGRLMKRTGVSKKSGKQYNYYCCEKFPHLLLRHLRRTGEGRLPCLRPHHVQEIRSGLQASLLHQPGVRKFPAGGSARLSQADCCVRWDGKRDKWYRSGRSADVRNCPNGGI